MKWMLLLYLIVVMAVNVKVAIKYDDNRDARIGASFFIFLSAMFATWFYWSSGLFG